MSPNRVDYRQVCERVCETARRAGTFIAEQRAGFSFGNVEFKGAHDMVSYVDRESERMIVAALRDILPEAGFIAEEGTAGANGERYRWVIDPLDGTTNFVHGMPPYCVSIALLGDERLVMGVVYEVTLGELFWAWEGSPARLNGKPITPSAVDRMEHSLVAIGFAHGARDNVQGFLDEIAYYQKHTDGIRRTGSAVANLVYVACGRFDAFAQTRLAAWDVAAGAFIARQAGARVTDYAGGENFLFGGEILATNGSLHEQYLKTIR